MTVREIVAWKVTRVRHSDHYWVQTPSSQWPDGIMYLCKARYRKSADYIANGLNKVEYLEAENKRLKATLKFYAEGEWSDGYPGGIKIRKDDGVYLDFGEHARKALKGEST